VGPAHYRFHETACAVSIYILLTYLFTCIEHHWAPPDRLIPGQWRRENTQRAVWGRVGALAAWSRDRQTNQDPRRNVQNCSLTTRGLGVSRVKQRTLYWYMSSHTGVCRLKTENRRPQLTDCIRRVFDLHIAKSCDRLFRTLVYMLPHHGPHCNTPTFSVPSCHQSVGCCSSFQPNPPCAATSTHHSVDHLISRENVDQGIHATINWLQQIRQDSDTPPAVQLICGARPSSVDTERRYDPGHRL